MTIHNLEFKVEFPDSMLWELFEWAMSAMQTEPYTLEWLSQLDEAGILYADQWHLYHQAMQVKIGHQIWHAGGSNSADGDQVAGR